MKTENSACKRRSCILVEGPRYGDATFYGHWLLSAAKANELLQQAKRDDPTFGREIAILEESQFLDFGISATRFISRFADKEFDTFVITTKPEDLNTLYDLVDFVLMVEMGFFTLTGDRYQTTLPRNLDMDRVKQAHLKISGALDETEDEDWIHPEQLVADMHYTQATKYQRLLRKMNQDQRLADRRALLFLD